MMKRHRRGLHVVKPQSNPTEEDKSSSINVKQVMLIGAITALTGTVVGAVSMELYRYLRPKIPLPQPQPYQVPPQVAQNPGYPWGMPSAYPNPVPMQPQYSVQQIGAFPTPGALPQPNYGSPLALAAAAAPVQPAPAVPTLPNGDPEPLSRAELARWQRGLESWQRDLERRDAAPMRDDMRSVS